ncbi:TNF receptor-associated factor 2-like [Lingula anatina]|uniref:TNF receptor-associated factor 2-like n=1 Tax=Lingula anatina TaxID=7574 RepID=A0A1S3IQ17_LINAN|nr:TNF receptor-associated factor 2-like [Lingula anatina]|eukprot:XP_013399629.1 TNF receptor-associated factor 2-like [Lingula anatina]
MIAHQETECPKNKRTCPYGCELGDGSIEEHMESSAVVHLDFLRDKVTILQIHADSVRDGSRAREQISARVSCLQDQLTECDRKRGDIEKKTEDAMQTRERRERSNAEQFSAEVAQLTSRNGAMNSQVDTFEGMVAVLNREVEKVCCTLESYPAQRSLDVEGIDFQERKVKTIERALALKDVTMAEQDLRLQALENASYDGVLVWKVNEFARKRHDAVSGRATSIYSNAFYTGPHGYKMCCRLYLNGDGMGKGTHISLFFVVMRGYYDALLKWPFSQKVTLMLLDLNNREHVQDAFRPDPTSSSFQRPTSEMNIASGCPLFVPLSQLQRPGTAYIKDDAIFIKVVVDCKDL